MQDKSIKLWTDYFSGKLDAHIKAAKLVMAYQNSEDDTQLKQYEFEKSTIEALLHELSAIQLKALIMHEKDRQSWQTVSEKLNVKRGSLTDMKYKLNKKLRKELAAHGG